VGGVTFISRDRRKVRQALIDIDANRVPEPGPGLKTAIVLGWVHIERSHEGEDLILTNEGQALARQWRDDDSHAGSAA
jgi:hypothetical protein